MLWNPDIHELVCTHSLLTTRTVKILRQVTHLDLIPEMGFFTQDCKEYSLFSPSPFFVGAKKVTYSELSFSSDINNVLRYITITMPEVYIGAVYHQGRYHLIPRRHNLHLYQV